MSAAQNIAIPVQADKDVQIIRANVVMDRAACAAFEANMNRWLLEPAILHVFDFTDTMSIDQAFYQFFGNYKRSLAKNKKFIASINLREGLVRQLSASGMTQMFNVVPSLDKAKVQAGLIAETKKAVKLDASLLKHFVDGTLSALQIQANIPVKALPAKLKDANTPSVEIAGVITLNNPDMPGSIAICFPKNVFLGIYESMVGEKHSEINQDIQDAAAELLNIVYGHAKAKLAEMGIKLEMAIPVVLAGEKLKMQMGDAGKSVILPFECKYGNFHIEVYFKKVST